MSGTQQIGLGGSKYLGHSFRNGAATTVVEKGISDATIQILSRWKSDAYKRYIRPLGNNWQLSRLG